MSGEIVRRTEPNKSRVGSGARFSLRGRIRIRPDAMEVAKTWALVVLVGTSLVFTWYLWFGFESAFSPLSEVREGMPAGSQGPTGTTGSSAGPNTAWRLWAVVEGSSGGPAATGSSGPNATSPGSGKPGEGNGEGSGEEGGNIVQDAARLTPAKALSPFQLLIRVDGRNQYLLTYGSRIFDEIYEDGGFFRDIGLQYPVPVTDVSSKDTTAESTGGGPAGGASGGKTIGSGQRPESEKALERSASEPGEKGTGQGADGLRTNALTAEELESVRGEAGIELIFMRPLPLDGFFKAAGYDVSGSDWTALARRILIAREPAPSEPSSSSPPSQGLKGQGQKEGESKRSIGVWAEVLPGGEYVRLPMRAEEVRFKRVLRKDFPTSLLAEEIEPLSPPVPDIPSGLYVLRRPPRTGPLGITWEAPAPGVLESMLRSFFIDLTVLRQIEERDGAVIYTDGRRGLRVYPYGMIEYTAPPQPVSPAPASPQGPTALSDALALSFEFVDLHGGWLPNCLLWDFGEEASGGTQAGSAAGLAMRFSAAVGTMPVFLGHNAEPLIEVVVSRGGVSWYKRCVPSPGAEPRGRMETLRASNALRALFEHRKVTGGNSEKTTRVEGIHLGYFGLPDGESSQFLYPAWFVHLGDGSVVAVNANTGMVFEPVETP